MTPTSMGFLRRNRQEVLLLALILAIAAPLRLLALDRFPPGLYYDEKRPTLWTLLTHCAAASGPPFYDTQGGVVLLAVSFHNEGFITWRFAAA